MNTKALYKLSYGLYLLSARDGDRDNASIINTAIQVANEPTRLSVASIQKTFTHDMILKTGVFNVSALTTEAPFSLFQRFGMQSGRDADKFAGFEDVQRSENGLYYLTKNANAFFSCRVTESLDLGSHTLFIGELTDAQVLFDAVSCTYGYYQSDIKPRPAPKTPVKKGWRCTVCGYIHEGEHLPEDFICPICKHGVDVFEYFEAPADIPSPAVSSKRKFLCTVCGYVHEGDAPPEFCPVCNAPASKFKEIFD